ncbi:MAG: hypothetical protein IT559_02010 [Alphaproteobacteria bacterium]|nr:hypothetical protein [Alphaproteobacteria bacterium]
MKTFILALILAVISIPAMAQDLPHSHGLMPLKQVEAPYICMVTNKAFDREQIPVLVDGKTYYGCCAGCEARLKEDASIRAGVDPVSGNTVDKTEAVVGVDANNGVYYFENVENLHAFKPKMDTP